MTHRGATCLRHKDFIWGNHSSSPWLHVYWLLLWYFLSASIPVSFSNVSMYVCVNVPVGSSAKRSILFTPKTRANLWNYLSSCVFQAWRRYIINRPHTLHCPWMGFRGNSSTPLSVLMCTYRNPHYNANLSLTEFKFHKSKLQFMHYWDSILSTNVHKHQKSQAGGLKTVDES